MQKKEKAGIVLIAIMFLIGGLSIGYAARESEIKLSGYRPLNIRVINLTINGTDMSEHNKQLIGGSLQDCWYYECFGDECKGFRTWNVTDPEDPIFLRGQCDVLKDICEVRNNTNYIENCTWTIDTWKDKVIPTCICNVKLDKVLK